MREREVLFNINKEFDGFRLMDYLAGFKVNKTYINHLINIRKLFLNNVAVKNSNVKIYEGDIIRAILIVDDIQPYKFKLKVVYEDEWIIVINKPVNILVHSDGKTHETLTNAVNYHLYKKGEICSAYPIHRLDYETTGLVIFAKNKFALAYLSVAIEKHEMKKEYICLCKGVFSKSRGSISFPIGKDRHSGKQIACSSGKEAKSHYEVIINDAISKVKVTIEHGRRHQIRVHLAHIKHPIIGDMLYGNDQTAGLKLHFKRVVFFHPYTRKEMSIECKEDF